MRSDTGIVWECSASARCEFHAAGGSRSLPCTGGVFAKSFTPEKKLNAPEAIHAFEGWLIKSALERSRIDLEPGKSHAAATAELLGGITRQNLLLILDPVKGRHKNLSHLLVRLTKGGKQIRPLSHKR